MTVKLGTKCISEKKQNDTRCSTAIAILALIPSLFSTNLQPLFSETWSEFQFSWCLYGLLYLSLCLPSPRHITLYPGK